MRRTKLLSAVFLLLSVAACGGSSSDSLTGTNTGTGLGSGPMSATIDGKAWVSATPAVIYRNNIPSIAGIDAALTATISFASSVTTTGTYSLAFGSSNAGLGIISKGGQGWSSGVQGGTGSLTVT